MDPMVLMDCPEDGYCENVGWVEATVGALRASELIADFCSDDEGNVPARPKTPPTRVHLRLRNPEAHYEEQRWVPCAADADGAVEFWEFDTTDNRKVATT